MTAIQAATETCSRM